MQAVPVDSADEQAGTGRPAPGIAPCRGPAGPAPASLRTQPASAEQVSPEGCVLMPQAAGVKAQGHCIEAVLAQQSLGGLPALALHVRPPSSRSSSRHGAAHELW